MKARSCAPLLPSLYRGIRYRQGSGKRCAVVVGDGADGRAVGMVGSLGDDRVSVRVSLASTRCRPTPSVDHLGRLAGGKGRCAAGCRVALAAAVPRWWRRPR